MVKSIFKVIENKSEVESLTNVEANELRYLNFEL
jgi:predicted nuclease of restriction endonuclease-like RecB superfamily